MNLGKFELDLDKSGLNLDKCGLDLFHGFRYFDHILNSMRGKPPRTKRCYMVEGNKGRDWLPG